MMITDDVEAISSIIATRNINAIKLLCDHYCLPRDRFISALRTTPRYVNLTSSFVSELLNVADKYFGGFCEKDVLDYFLDNILTPFIYIEDTYNCCVRLFNEGAMTDNWKIVNLPENIFFEYCSDTLISNDMFVNIIKQDGIRPSNENIKNHVIDKWMSQYVACDINTVATLLRYAHNCEHFLRLSHFFYEREIHDAAMIYNIFSSSMQVLSHINDCVSESMHRDELLLAAKIAKGKLRCDGDAAVLLEKIDEMRRVDSSAINLDLCRNIMTILTTLLTLI